jgi:NAD(P)-dependent dehydrogenase (short-subunit alcohol dehydrogenase family)
MITPFAGNVADEADMVALVERIEVEFGPVALAFFNAGIGDFSRAGTLSAAAFRNLYAVNVFGIVHGLAPLLPRMIARGKGQIALNASLAGWRGLPRAAAYASSKAAVINLAECLKTDLDKAGIGIQVISPGFVATPMTARNDKPMPFLVSVDDAARRICDGFGKGRFEITFPRRLVFVMRLLSLMPRPLYFKLIAKMTGSR